MMLTKIARPTTAAANANGLLGEKRTVRILAFLRALTKHGPQGDATLTHAPARVRLRLAGAVG